MCISGFKLDNCSRATLPGWDITIHNATGYTQTRTTDSNGKFEFCDLAPGQYTLTETLKSGWIKISAPPEITLSCDNATNQNFTNQKLMCISGFKLDNCSRATLPGWDIAIHNATGYTQTKTTDSNGKFEFCDLAPGQYTLTETLKSGWIKISAPPEITLSCDNATNQNFTNQKLMCISGFKLDNCSRATLPGWDIAIHNATGYTQTKTTDSNGKFEFCDLAPGQYTLTETLKSGWIKMSAPPEITLSCDNATNQNFTNQKLMCISGFKLDNCSRATLPGWDIAIHNATGYTQTKTTDSNGKFEFCDLAPGQYILTETLKSGWIKISAPPAITLSCDNATNQNFTNQKLMCISGFKLDNCSRATLPGWDIAIT